MANKVKGNTRSLTPSEINAVQKLYGRRVEKSNLVNLDFAREIHALAIKIRRRIGALIDREGRVQEVFIGSREILYMPELGRYRLGKNRFRRLRLIFSCLSKNENEAELPEDILVDLEKLRFDVVVSVKQLKNRLALKFAYNLPFSKTRDDFYKVENVKDLANFKLDFSKFIEDLEQEHSIKAPKYPAVFEEQALLIGVYNQSESASKESMEELIELSKAANVNVVDTIIQRRKIDPKTLLGKGKLEEVVLQALRYGAELLIFDLELTPSQWRSITNATELKVIDRSMLILDIFGRRAKSKLGKLQVELAQLKYNLPRLVEKDKGLSRLAGGIGGRGPGETKLEIGRRRLRDRITLLEDRVRNLSANQELGAKKRKDNKLKHASLLGYTNVGKSTLFNALTNSDVLVANKLFATLDSTNRKVFLGNDENDSFKPKTAIISDTVGFIRDLPKELTQAFKGTLDELYNADLLLHVIGANEKDYVKKMDSVNKILTDMELLNTKLLVVVNKIDLIDEEKVEEISTFLSENAYEFSLVSAVKREGFEGLRKKIMKHLYE